jgi:hypothetical protein
MISAEKAPVALLEMLEQSYTLISNKRLNRAVEPFISFTIK